MSECCGCGKVVDVAGMQAKQRKVLEKAIRDFMQYADAMNLVNPGTVWYNLVITIRQQLSEIERGHRNGGKQSQSEIDKG